MATNSTTVKLTIKITSFILKLLVNIFVYIVIILLTINFSRIAYDFTYQLYGPVTVDAAPGTDMIFVIQDGDSTMNVATKLENQLLVKNKYAFYLKSKLQKVVIMPGSYALNSSMTYDEIINIITDYGASIKEDEASDTKEGTGTD